MKIFKKVFQYGEHQVTLETGGMARQATGAVTVRMGDAVILVTAVAIKKVKTGADFFPLTVNYQERLYSSGRIPGGFLKREGRPTDRETLIARLIDRPLRPLFPEGFFNEIQVVATVLSLDPNIEPDVAALIGASAAVSLAGVPFDGPIAGARVGYVSGQYVLNPSREVLKTSDLDLVVAGTDKAILMVESEAKELPEDVMLGAVLFGHEQMQIAIAAIQEMVKACGKEKWDWKALEAARENKESEEWKVEGAVNAYRYILKGLQLWEGKRYVQAVQDLERGLQLMPAFSESYVFLGDAYWHLGDIQKAGEMFQTLARKEPALLETLLKKYPDLRQSYAESTQGLRILNR